MAAGRTLIVGAGSGRDIASAVLALDPSLSGPVDFAGFLTPWAWHTFHGALETVVNDAEADAKKFVAHRPEEALSSFFEPYLPAVLRACGLDVDRVFLFSLQYGTAALKEALAALVEARGYERVLAVDVGGDVLAAADQFGTVLTPLVDFSCVDVLGGLPQGIDLELTVVAPGVCGELASEHLLRTFAQLENAGAVSGVGQFSFGDAAYRRFVAINNEIERLTTARSHTFQVMVDIASRGAGASAYSARYAKTYAIGRSCFTVDFPVTIDTALQNRIWHFDLRRARTALGRPTTAFTSIGDGFLRARAAGVCGTEVDCSSIAAPTASGRLEPLAYLLTPCCYARGDVRRAVLDAGLSATRAADGWPVVMLRRDAVTIDTSGLERVDLDEQFVIFNGPGVHERARATARFLTMGGAADANRSRRRDAVAH